MNDLDDVLFLPNKQMSTEAEVEKTKNLRNLTKQQQERMMIKAEFALERKVEDIVVENYDSIFKRSDDVYDK